MPKPKATVYIAVDPGAKGGIAIRDGSSVVTMPFEDGQIPEEVHAHADAGRFAFIVVERSESHWSRFRVHRADAKKAGEAIRKMFPRRNNLVYVDPGHWQGSLGVVGAKNPKGESYSDYAVSKLGAHPKATEDEKAALCILHWAEKVGVWEDNRGA
jgi:hypothetical protein